CARDAFGSGCDYW
nr:immunoglobulin heavy chain junction region [Macaca mulatta]MOX60184.1 immunoglobulin heavy chain junction region [Macaca mulatta]MOX60197.1 immunoglobulin heavy chain junction region [Macaca mulatta]MOX60473.1 immunoglobulin heavy chain junction region [Macaca mulatta]MOX60501.1 immunoglobulin heavy chain junction region [Macaca mulatta]